MNFLNWVLKFDCGAVANADVWSVLVTHLIGGKKYMENVQFYSIPMSGLELLRTTLEPKRASPGLLGPEWVLNEFCDRGAQMD